MRAGGAASLRRASLALALLLTAGAGAGAASGRAGDTPDAVREPRVTTIDHVRLDAAGKQWSGFALAPDSASGFALLTDDGRVALLARAPKPATLETRSRPVSAVPAAALAAGLAHAEEAVRDRCEQLLLAQGNLSQPALAAAVNDASPESRRRALTIASKLAPADPKAAQAWVGRARSRLTDGDEGVRRAALAAYSAAGADDVREKCEELLQFDDSIRVRHDAIVQLGRTHDLRAVDPLFAQLAESEDRSLQVATFDALRRLTGKNYGRDEARWRAWWKNHRTELLPDPAR